LSAEGYGTAANPNTPVPNSPFVLRLDGQVADDGTAFGTWTITYDNWPIVLGGTWVALLANGSGVLAVRPSGPGTGGAGGVRPVLAGDGGGLLGGSPGLDAGASPPLAPSNLTAITSWTEIDLSWLDNANNETGFKIESSRGSTAGYTELASLQPDATSYSDKGLLPATTYYYRIYAYNDSGNSTYLQANFTTRSCSTNRDCPAQLNCYQSMCQSPELTPPARFTNEAAVPSWTKIDFTWTDNANNEAGFRIERSTGGASYTVVAMLPPNTTSYSDTGLLPGTLYHYRFYVFNAIGESGGDVGFAPPVTKKCGSNTDCPAGISCSSIGACGTACVTDSNCPAGNTCSSAGACVPATPVSPGDGGTVPDAQPAKPDVRVPIDAPINPASLTISPASATFPGVVGTTSDPITFIVKNNGTASSGAVTAALGGAGAAQFSITTNTCSGVLAGLATCAVAVAYKPTAAGAVTATLTATDATVGSTPAVATLTGSAVTEGVLYITGPADLGPVAVGQSSAAAFTVSNGGGSAAPSVVLGPPNDPQFAIGNNMCTDLAPAATCTFAVTFTPASAGLKTTVLTARSGDISGQKPIQGTGVAAPSTSFSGFKQGWKCGDPVNLGDQGSQEACLQACEKQDHPSGCWYLDGTGGFIRDCNYCKSNRTVYGGYQNDWAGDFIYP
jgi:hypothetical protein